MGKDASSAFNYIRSKFVIASGMRELIKKHSLKIKYGVFSKAETETVKRAMDKFLEERNLKMEDLQRSLVEGGDFPIKEMIYECTQVSETRTYYGMFNHIAYTYHPYVRSKITEEEEVELLNLVNEKGFKWKEIGYHLLKYKDLCQRKYLMLIGEKSPNLSKRRIEMLLTHMPSTEEEWGVVCRELKQKKSTILRIVNRFLNGKQLCGRETGKIEIQLCLLILNNNHYCKFSCNTESILKYLDGDIEALGIINHESDNSIRRANVATSMTEGEASMTEGEASMTKEEASMTEGEASMTEGEASMTEPSADPLQETQRSCQNSHERFLGRFLDLFYISEDFNLNININKDDIFWYNITREINLEKALSIARFNELGQIYRWKTFGDIYDTVVKLAYDYAVLRTKKSLIQNISKTDKS